MTLEALVGELRSALAARPTQERWRAVCSTLERIERQAPSMFEETWVPYAERELERWPSRLREAPDRWVEALWRGVDASAVWRLARRVTFHGQHARRDWGRVFEASALSEVEHVTIHGARFDDDDARLMAKRVSWPSLRALELPFNALRLTGVRAIAESERLRALQRLSLERNTVTDDAAVALARDARFEDLRHLDLSWNQLGRDAATSLPGSTRLAALERIDLSDNRLCEAPMWAHATHMTRLRELELGRTSLGGYGALGLADGPMPPALTYLGLSHNDLDDRTIEAFVKAPWFERLEHLDLTGNWLQDRSAHVLLEFAAHGRLEVLELGSNYISDDFLERADVPAHLELRLDG